MLNLLGKGEGFSQQLCTCFPWMNEMFPCASAECWQETLAVLAAPKSITGEGRFCLPFHGYLPRSV